MKSFYDKTLGKMGIERTYPNTTKATCQTYCWHIGLGKAGNFPIKIWSQKRVLILSIVIQDSPASLSLSP